jgi:uncharacterized protein (DUF488 family)
MSLSCPRRAAYKRTVPDSRIWTIGHSTRTLDDFVAMLRAHAIQRLVDVRTVPGSRRHPHFGGEALAAALAGIGLEYQHVPALGGLRKARSDSTNLGWKHASFRGYADHMQTPAFAGALEDLERSGATATVLMCAEAVWWRCHRQLIADALVARGHEVLHIMSNRKAEPHRLTAFARVIDRRVDYPGLLG